MFSNEKLTPPVCPKTGKPIKQKGKFHLILPAIDDLGVSQVPLAFVGLAGVLFILGLSLK